MMSPKSDNRHVVYSAPGKVLLAGGYLVLDRQFNGLVHGLDARLHICVEAKPRERHDSSKDSQIFVQSPQFRNAFWQYRAFVPSVKDAAILLEPIQVKDAEVDGNPFVQTALCYSLTYILASTQVLPVSYHVTILADSDYYSQATGKHSLSCYDEPKPLADIHTSQKDFVNFGRPMRDIHKTGLGSSAALVTALVAAILHHSILSMPGVCTSGENDSIGSFYTKFRGDDGNSIIHNLSQAAHCAAQGKIGSGFDVAAAIYGSCVYRRFTPSVLEQLGECNSAGFAARLMHLVEGTSPSLTSTPHLTSTPWDMEIRKDAASLPHGLRLIMADVDCGSATVGMVRNFMTWRVRNTDKATSLIARLNTANEDLIQEFQHLACRINADFSDVSAAIRLRVDAIRQSIREISQQSNVPIETAAMTDIIDHCCQIPTVINGIVPGAGGFDAIAFIIKDDALTPGILQDTLDKYWQSKVLRYKERESSGDAKNDHPDIGRITLLRVRQSDQGVRREDAALYSKWLA